VTRRGRLRVALTAALSGVAALAAVELGFRVRAWVHPVPAWISLEHFPHNPRGYFRPCEGGTFCPNLDRTALGCDAPVDASRGQVVFVGDSFTWGQGVDAIDTYPSLIEFPRDQRRNCAMTGYQVEDVHRTVVDLTARLHPRLVVYGMVLNDFGMYAPDDTTFSDVGGFTMIADYMNFRTGNLDEYVRSRHHSAPLRALLSVSETARYFYRARVMRHISHLTIESYKNAFRGEPAARGFKLIRDMAARAGPRFLVVLWPLFIDFQHYPLEDVHRAIVDELRRSRIEVLDLLDAFRGRDASRLIVYETDQHPNDDAHRIAAAAVREKLRALGWPPFDR
jgi:hypothetical protein